MRGVNRERGAASSARAKRRGFLVLALSAVLAVAPALPSAAEGLNGDLDGNQGTLMVYGTFRYKPASNSTYVTVSSWSPRHNNGMACGAFIRLGLRSQSGDQVTPTYQWDSPGAQIRFLTNAGNNLSSGTYYAFNGRTSYSGSTQYCGTVTWNGSLAL